VILTLPTAEGTAYPEERCRTSRVGRPPAAEEVLVSDKSPHKTTAKKPGKTIKQKRAEKRAKHASATDHDFIAHVRER
jgi:hypothetical protein